MKKTNSDSPLQWIFALGITFVLLFLIANGVQSTTSTTADADVAIGQEPPAQPNRTLAKNPEPSMEAAERGRLVVARILDKQGEIDAFYRAPSIWGLMTALPKSLLTLPAGSWSSLIETEQMDVIAYTESYIPRMRRDPFTYSNLPPTSRSAPLAPQMRRNAGKMTLQGWVIYEGRVDGRDIIMNHVVAEGQ